MDVDHKSLLIKYFVYFHKHIHVLDADFWGYNRQTNFLASFQQEVLRKNKIKQSNNNTDRCVGI